jgi:hypothetical protein
MFMEIPDVNEFISGRQKLIDEIEQKLDDDEAVRDAEKSLLEMMRQQMDRIVEQMGKEEEI